jgi:hypothetical protein
MLGLDVTLAAWALLSTASGDDQIGALVVLAAVVVNLIWAFGLKLRKPAISALVQTAVNDAVKQHVEEATHLLRGRLSDLEVTTEHIRDMVENIATRQVDFIHDDGGRRNNAFKGGRRWDDPQDEGTPK